MARSPLIDTDFVPTQPPGHDTASLGPSDSSDSGSDVASIAPDDGSASDSAGTGERRGAAGDANLPEAADIGVDRVVESLDEVGAAAPQSVRARLRKLQRGGRSLPGPRRR